MSKDDVREQLAWLLAVTSLSTTIERRAMKQIACMLIATSFLSACIAGPNLHGCDGGDRPQLFASDPREIVLHVASPVFSESRQPYLALGAVGAHPGIRVDLQQIALSDEPPVHATSCGSVELRSFLLQVAEPEWRAYWDESRKARKFSAGIAVPGMSETTRMEEIGFALGDVESGAVEIACGCVRRR